MNITKMELARRALMIPKFFWLQVE